MMASLRMVLLVTLGCAQLVHAADKPTVPPCTSAPADCTEWIASGAGPSRLLVYRSFPLTKRNENVTRALVFVHGIKRDADSHYRTALAAEFLAGRLNDTLLVAPRFASNAGGPCADVVAPDEARWVCEADRADSWRVGGGEVGGEASSFDYMDALLRGLARKDVFPNLKAIVVAGHSAGGQYVMRYAMLTQVDDTLGVPVSYVVSNPSSYAYVDGVRPTAASPSGFAPYPEGKECPEYDTWPYGLKGRTGYGAKLTNQAITRQLARRPVTYLLGETDVLPVGVFDTSCAAMAQGPTRLARGQAFGRYMKEIQGATHATLVVPFCGHSARCVFTADVALPVIFPGQ